MHPFVTLQSIGLLFTDLFDRVFNVLPHDLFTDPLTELRSKTHQSYESILILQSPSLFDLY
eukprot:jgi/Psemu1/307774/fgenesh1_kg.352_\